MIWVVSSTQLNGCSKFPDSFLWLFFSFFFFFFFFGMQQSLFSACVRASWESIITYRVIEVIDRKVQSHAQTTFCLKMWSGNKTN